MKETTTLKIGICACTQLFHGEIAGREIQIGSRKFALEEVQIPGGEKRQSKALKENGCHFFIDVHGYSVSLRFNWAVRLGPKQRWRLYQPYEEKKIRYWSPASEEEPPTSDQLENDIRDKIEEFTEEIRKEWFSGLSQMAEQLASAAT